LIHSSSFLTPQKTPQKIPRKILTELEAKILGEIKKDPHISRIRIANVLKLSEYTVKEYLEKLKHKEVIERIGPAKGGYWRVRKDDE
jgi:ATP-dependent DNA helicase RecG